MNRLWIVLLMYFSLSELACIAGAEPPPATLDFNRDIRPIISDNCFKCHGPDAAARKEDLRFDRREGLFGTTKQGMDIVVPGDPGDSELYYRITHEDRDERMPPADQTRQLSQDDIETLRRWIEQGAVWEGHWAFEPVPPARIPRVSDPRDWVHNPIDAFILDRLNKEGLAPRDAAGKERLLRRVTLDLTGLPPTIDEMDAFLSDESADAYEKVIDRLLASPHYGEQRALEWLDSARYADTHGYDNDRDNDAWPWRDWVIRAFNDNLGYDEFARWQLAGDLLQNPTQDQVVATAFNRIHRQNGESGSVPEEFRVEYAADRVETFATAFMGMTMQCARCHDHKFDPISQREYYGIFAFFSNIQEPGILPDATHNQPTPTAFVYGEGEAERHEKFKKAIREAEADLSESHNGSEESFDQWRAATGGAVVAPIPLVYMPFDYKSEDTTPNLAGARIPAEMFQSPELVPGRAGKAIQFSGSNSISVDQAGAFDRTDSFSFSLWIRPRQNSAKMVVLHRSVVETGALETGSRGFELLLEDGRPAVSLNHNWPGNALRVKAMAPLSLAEWTHIIVTYDGSSRAAGVTMYVNGASASVEVIRDNLYDSLLYKGTPLASREPPLTLGARMRDPGFQGAVDEFKLFGSCLTSLEVRKLASTEGIAEPESAADEEGLLDYYIARFSGEYASAQRSLKKARDAEQAFVHRLNKVMVMREKATPPRTFVRERGAYDSLGEEVPAGVPSNILPFPSDQPRNRLGLAHWLVQRDHPLTARVAVNRYWKVFYGRGLVDTMEDFGSQGTMPSHPELLDFLAAWFMENDWDVKALCKLIVSSATYQQASAASLEEIERDPQNIMLARGPHHRMSAEQIRDSALMASGLLTRTVGGRSVKPYQPDGIYEGASASRYDQDTGPALYRRSMYTFWKRTVPPPNMMMFDAVSREACTVQREVTMTPLQALVLLNDPQFVEAARVLASSVLIRHGADTQGAVRESFRRLISREPTGSEIVVLIAAYEEQLRMYASAQDGARKYIQVGASPVDEGHDPVRLAAMTAVVQMIMIQDGFQVIS